MEDQECAIQVVFPECMHVFGIKCFGKLIFSDGPTSNKCPLCRAVWFKKLDPWRVGLAAIDRRRMEARENRQKVIRVLKAVLNIIIPTG